MHCHIEGKITVPESLHEKRGAGIANVLVKRGNICDHEFLAFVDKNFKVRGYSPVDFIPEAPEDFKPAITYKKAPEDLLSPEEKAHLESIGNQCHGLFNTFLKSPGMLSVFLLDWRGRVITGISQEEFGFQEISGIVTEIMSMGTHIGGRLKLADVKRFLMVGQDNDSIVEKVGDSYVMVTVYNKNVKLGLLNFEIKQLKVKMQTILYES